MLNTTFKKIARNRRGDTIVEVLIALTVVSLVLGGAYVSTNNSLNNSRATQERGNALKLVESQLEQLKGIVATNTVPDPVFDAAAPNPFCIFFDPVTSKSIVFAATDLKCGVDSSGNQTSTEPVYHISIARSGNDFKVRSTWTKVSKGTQENVTISYREYK